MADEKKVEKADDETIEKLKAAGAIQTESRPGFRLCKGCGFYGHFRVNPCKVCGKPF